MSESKDYRNILIALYQRHNPEKVKDVDFLLQKFEGREQEMIDKIRSKYPDPAPIPVAQPPVVAPQPQPAQITPAKTKKRFPLTMWVMLGILILGGGGVGLWWSYFQTPPAREMLYVVADTLYTHNFCDLGKESRLTFLPYGAPVEVWEQEAFCVETMIDTQRHYIPRKYLAPEKEWLGMDGIYGNPQARELYDDSYEKRALRDLFRDRGWIGHIPEEKRHLWEEGELNKPVWQVFGLAESPSNVVANGNFEPTPSGKHPEEFAVIISKRLNPEERKLLVFDFDDDLQGRLIAEQDLDEYPQYFIRKVTREDLEDLYRFPDDPIELIRSGQDGFLMEKANQKGKKYLCVVEGGQISIYNNRWGFLDLF